MTKCGNPECTAELKGKRTKWCSPQCRKRCNDVLYYQNHKVDVIRKRTDWWQKNKATATKIHKRSRLRRVYNLSVEEHDQIRTRQNNRCVICTRTFDTTMPPCLDHDHTTGTIRAMLCRDCNRGLGCFHDDPVLLQAALTYLLSHSSQPILP